MTPANEELSTKEVLRKILGKHECTMSTEERQRFIKAEKVLATFVAERERVAQYEVAIFVDMCAAQCAEKARAIHEPNHWWWKNRILTQVAEQIRERATRELSAQEGGTR